VVNYWRLARTYWSIHLRTAMEYRINFFVQSGFMALNNALYLVAIFFLVGGIGTIKGYDFAHIATLFAISAVSFGITGVFFGGIKSLSEDIENGAIDHHLSVPVDPLISKGLSGMEEDNAGDIVFGIIVIIAFASNILLALGLSLLVSLLWMSVLLSASSLPFYLERSSRLSQSIRAVAVGFSSWPVNVYRPLVRAVLFITLLAFLGAYPADLVRTFTWQGFGILLSAIVIGLTVSLTFFYRGLRRYESGNLVGMRG